MPPIRSITHSRTHSLPCTIDVFLQVKSREPNKYIPLETLVEMGHSKLVQQMDAKVAAAAAGLDLRPLLTAEIQVGGWVG